MTFGERVVIIGNSGSGKSTLARELAQRAGVRSIDLDRIHWQDKVGVKREEGLATAMVVEAAGQPAGLLKAFTDGWPRPRCRSRPR